MTSLSCRVVRPVAHGGRSGSAAARGRLLRQCARQRLEQRRHRRERVARRAVARVRRDRQARRGAERRAHRRADRVDDRRRRVGARRQQRADCACRAAGRVRARAEQAAARRCRRTGRARQRAGRLPEGRRTARKCAVTEPSAPVSAPAGLPPVRPLTRFVIGAIGLLPAAPDSVPTTYSRRLAPAPAGSSRRGCRAC